MAKRAPVAKPKPNRTLWMIIGLVSVGAYAFFALDDNAPAKKPISKKTRTALKGKTDIYLPEDYKAKFAPVAADPRNVFVPLITKPKEAVLATNIPTSDGSIPEAFTGQAGWAYTGYLEINGQATALLENDKTGEGEYVTPGKPFKKGRILVVTNDEIVIQGPTRITRSVKLGAQQDKEVAPATPALSGAIGNGLAVQPLPNPAGAVAGVGGVNPQTFAVDPNQGQNNLPQGGGRRRGGRRRNNNAGGF